MRIHPHHLQNQTSQPDNNILLTLTTGVLLFIISQYILELIIKPHKRYNDIKSEVQNKVKFYAGVITSPLVFEAGKTENDSVVKNYMEASKEIRKLSCDLESIYYSVPKFIRNIFIKENEEAVLEAASLLIRLSNSLYVFPYSNSPSQGLSNHDDLEKIKINLNLSRKSA